MARRVVAQRTSRLREPGQDVGEGIHEQPWGRFVTLGDPDGDGLVVQETAAGSPAG